MLLHEREGELTQLSELLGQARDGAGRLVPIGGEAGIGKTSLVSAFLIDHRPEDLHRKLEAVPGHDEADTSMAHLPPVTWNEVASKNDVDAAVDRLGTQLRAEIQVLGSDLRREFVEATNRQIKWTVTFAAAWTSILITVVRLLG